MKLPVYPASIQPLLDYFDQLIPLNEQDRELVKTKFHSRLYRKRQFVLQEGDVCSQFIPWACLFAITHIAGMLGQYEVTFTSKFRTTI